MMKCSGNKKYIIIHKYEYNAQNLINISLLLIRISVLRYNRTYPNDKNKSDLNRTKPIKNKKQTVLKSKCNLTYKKY